MDRDFRTYALDRVSSADARQIARLFYPLLGADDRPTANEMLAAARPLLETVLDHHREAAYLAPIADGKYQPELLFNKQLEITERIRLHPALIWKEDNVAQHMVQSRKPS